MSAAIEIRTEPVASSKHDATLLDVAARLRSIASSVAESVTMHAEDQADALGQILAQLNLEYMRLGSAQTTAYEFAAVESEEAAERAWNAEHSAVTP